MTNVIAHGPQVNRKTRSSGVLACPFPNQFRSGMSPLAIIIETNLLFSFVKNRVYKIDD